MNNLKELNDGLRITAFARDPKRPVPIAEALRERHALIVVKADLKKYALTLLNKSELAFDGSAPDVATENDLLVATNASMYAKDLLKSVGYMRNFDHVNNAANGGKFKGLLLFNPKRDNLPAIQIIEKSAVDWQSQAAQYNSVIETFRMLSRDGENMWKPDSAHYYQAALVGVDNSEHVLFFFYPPAIDMYELNQFILSLDLNLTGLLYLDGDSKGMLYFAESTGLKSIGFDGSLPNILGLKAR